MSPAQVNGETPPPQSAFLRHVLSYPVVSDGIDSVRASPLAQRSLKMGDSVYQTLAAPVLPLLRGPYGYVSPYLERADAMVDRTLDRVDERFPAIKRPTSELYSETRELAMVPLHKAAEGRDYVLDIYAAECKKTEQPGLITQTRAVVTTALVVSNDTLEWLGHFVNNKRKDGGGSDAPTPCQEKVNGK